MLGNVWQIHRSPLRRRDERLRHRDQVREVLTHEVRDRTGLLARLLDGQRVPSTTHHTHHRATMNKKEAAEALFQALDRLTDKQCVNQIALIMLAQKAGIDSIELMKDAQRVYDVERLNRKID